MSMTLATAILMLTLLVMPRAGLAASAAAGQAVFNRCKMCHALAAGKHSPVGPNLHDLFGRKAGTESGFVYSQAMKQSGIVWDDATLAKYLRDPKTFMPGNRMAVPGIKDDEQLANLLAYLHEATK